MSEQNLTPRRIKEEQEDRILHAFAAKSKHSRGRVWQNDPPCDVRTAYERDVGRIIFSLDFVACVTKPRFFSIRRTITSARGWSMSSMSITLPIPLAGGWV